MQIFAYLCFLSQDVDEELAADFCIRTINGSCYKGDQALILDLTSEWSLYSICLDLPEYVWIITPSSVL